MSFNISLNNLVNNLLSKHQLKIITKYISTALNRDKFRITEEKKKKKVPPLSQRDLIFLRSAPLFCDINIAFLNQLAEYLPSFQLRNRDWKREILT